MGDVQFWHVALITIGLISGWLSSYSRLREKVIRLEENVKNLHENHDRTEKLIEEIKDTTTKIWERLDRKADK